ncbi:MAG TPA: hypothetical protein VF616_18860 [Duganella sp.]|uniref:hypothetical protein n=1 Tax=Duganella sp. TaxID=1904440 RepID=UPI002ED14528
MPIQISFHRPDFLKSEEFPTLKKIFHKEKDLTPPISNDMERLEKLKQESRASRHRLFGGLVAWQKKETAQSGDWSAIKKAPIIAPNGVQISLQEVMIQNGHDCKLMALANLDNYYASALKIPNIPVHKNHQGFFVDERNEYGAKANPNVSVRQMAKKYGSLQGEILESRILGKVAQEMGYSSQVLAPKNLDEFKRHITKQLSKGRPMVACFAVSKGHAGDAPLGFPSNIYKDNEHACVISGIDTNGETITISHWGNKFVVPTSAFYQSMNLLPQTREAETYKKTNEIPLFTEKTRTEIHRNSTSVRLMGSYLKYDLVHENNAPNPNPSDVRTSISPKRKSGFNNRLFVITPNAANPRWNAVTPASNSPADQT